MFWRRAEGEEGRDEGEEGEGVEVEGSGFAPAGDDVAGDGGAEEAGSMEDGTIDGDGGADLVGVDQFRDEGIDGGHFEGEDDAEEGCDGDDMPDLDLLGMDEPADGES